MSCTQDGVEWVVVGRAAKGGSWVMWRFTGVSSGGGGGGGGGFELMARAWKRGRRAEEGKAAAIAATAATFEEEDRRMRALMYELAPRKRGREREGTRRQERETKFSPARG